MRKCGICREVYNSRERTPRFLQTCGHTFCERCLRIALKNGVITCPLDGDTCHVGPDGVEHLPLNLSLLERTNDINGDDSTPVVPLSLWIPPEKLELGAKLGEGAFGEVRTAWLEEAGRRVPVAVKCLFHSSLSSLRVQRDGAVVQSTADAAFAKEMEMLFFASKHCAFVCQLIGICRKAGKVCIVMKKYKHSIRDLMRKQNGKLELKQLLRYGAHICRAMAELHKMGVLMRDLKPANFLIDDYDFAVVADFGLSKFLNVGGPGCPGSGNGEAAGTPNYMAPEAWTGECLVKETDIWSFACSVITMMAGEPPWDDIADTKVIKARVVQQRVKPTLPEGLPPQVARVLTRCFSYDWRSRPSFDDLLDVFQNAKDNLLDTKKVVVCRSPSMDSPVCVLSNDFDELDKCCIHSGSSIDRCLPGSWVKLKASGRSPGRDQLQEETSVINAVYGMVGVVRQVQSNGRVAVVYSVVDAPLTFMADDLEVVPSLRVGDSVRVKDSVVTPRLGWGDAVTHQTIGMVTGIDEDVSAVTVVFPGGQACVGCKVDPSELDLVARPFRKKDWVTVKATALSSPGDWRDIKETSIGVVQSIKDGKLVVAFCSRSQPLIVDPLTLEAIFPPPFQVNDCVRVKASISRPTFDWGRESHRSVGPIIRVRDNGLLEVQFHHRPDIWMADPGDMEIVVPARPFQTGDWTAVRRYVDEPKFRWGDVSRNSTGIVSGVRHDGTLEVGFCYLAKPWLGDPSEMALYQPPPFQVSDRVKVKMSVKEPRFKWAGQSHTSIGTVAKIGDRGLLEVKFPNRKESWYADPAEMIVVPPPVFQKGSWVRPNAAAFSRRHLPSWDGVSMSSLGIVQSVDGEILSVAFCTRSTPLVVKREDMEAVDPQPFKVSDIVVRREMPKEQNNRLCGMPDTPAADKSGPVINIRENGALEVQVWHRSDILVADPAEMKVLHPARPFRKGDWTGMKRNIQERQKWGPLKRSSVGIVKSVLEGGMLEVNFCCDETQPLCLEASDMVLYYPPPFQLGDCVKVKRSVIQPTFKWGGETHRSVGPVIKIRRNGILEVQFADRSDIWIGDPADMEVVHRARPFQQGDWTSVKRTVKTPKYKWGLADAASLGRVSEVLPDGGLLVDFCFCKRWFADPTDMVLYMPPPFQVGDGVKVKRCVETPRCGWGGEPRWRTGSVVKIRDDGTLEVQFSHRSDIWLADPADMFVYRPARPFRKGDWMGIKRGAGELLFPWGEEEKASIGIVSSVLDGGAVEVVFCCSNRKWIADANDLVLYDPPPFNVNDSVKVKASVKTPRLGWEDITPQSIGVVTLIRENGILEVQFPSRPTVWIADPSDMIVRREPHSAPK